MKEQLTRVLGKLPQTNMENVMSITSQPAEVAVANRYLLPVPEVTIAPTFRGTENGTSLIVSVKLFYHGSGKEVATTMQGKQEILQGIKRVNVDKNGKATFGKLKVMEVSSKHRHQSFCLAFYLEEYSAQGNKRILTHVKSTPFHVQSRPAKRKSKLNCFLKSIFRRLTGHSRRSRRTYRKSRGRGSRRMRAEEAKEGS